MHSRAIDAALPTPVGDALADPRHCIDNLLADAWKALNLGSILKSCGFRKRSGVPVELAVYALLLWKWLDASSIAMFARESLAAFVGCGRDVLYELLKRPDADWRGANLRAAKRVFRRHGLAHSRARAFVLDDSIKRRRGSKMEGTSSHFDHVEGRCVVGHQVLTLGVATDDAFLPVDSQIFVGRTMATPAAARGDGRCAAARRWREASERSKPEMAEAMLRRAKAQGIDADHLVADAWYGTVRMLRAAVSLDLTAILRMKKGRLKFRLVDIGGLRLLDAEGLYKTVKGNWRKVRGLPWRAASLDVDVNLSKSAKNPNWRRVRLLFVRGMADDGKAQAGARDWALFLCSDPRLGPAAILETYALRWGVEVYFKEAKRHLGFLAEQTRSFASHTASIHLSAIRYLMLADAVLDGAADRAADARREIKDRLQCLNFAARLWAAFRAVVHGALREIEAEWGVSADAAAERVDRRMHEFLTRCLQLDAFTLRLEYD